MIHSQIIAKIENDYTEVEVDQIFKLKHGELKIENEKNTTNSFIQLGITFSPILTKKTYFYDAYFRSLN